MTDEQTNGRTDRQTLSKDVSCIIKSKKNMQPQTNRMSSCYVMSWIPIWPKFSKISLLYCIVLSWYTGPSAPKGHWLAGRDGPKIGQFWAQRFVKNWPPLLFSTLRAKISCKSHERFFGHNSITKQVSIFRINLDSWVQKWLNLKKDKISEHIGLIIRSMMFPRLHEPAINQTTI